jgi:hypothetical protein
VDCASTCRRLGVDRTSSDLDDHGVPGGNGTAVGLSGWGNTSLEWSVETINGSNANGGPIPTIVEIRAAAKNYPN